MPKEIINSIQMEDVGMFVLRYILASISCSNFTYEKQELATDIEAYLKSHYKEESND